MTSKLYLGLGILILIASGVGFLYLIFVGIGPHQVCHTDYAGWETNTYCKTVEGYELYKENFSSTLFSLVALIVGDLFVLSYIFPIRHSTINKTAFWSILVLLVSFLLVVLGYLIIYSIVYFNTTYYIQL